MQRLRAWVRSGPGPSLCDLGERWQRLWGPAREEQRDLVVGGCVLCKGWQGSVPWGRHKVDASAGVGAGRTTRSLQLEDARRTLGWGCWGCGGSPGVHAGAGGGVAGHWVVVLEGTCCRAGASSEALGLPMQQGLRPPHHTPEGTALLC